MKTKLTYSVEIIKDPDQLTEAFGLRYMVYKESYPKLLPDAAIPYEVDAYDCRSIHLGLFCGEGNEKKLAGYCRLILPEFFANNFSNVLITYNQLYSYVQSSKSETRLSLIDKLPENDQEKINSFCNSLENNNIAYAETSRFIICEDHRSLALSSFFVSGMIAILLSHNIPYNFFTCTHHHLSFYKKFKLTPFPSIGEFDSEIMGKQHIVFGTDLSSENRWMVSIDDLIMQLQEENRITFRRAA